jgi:hypothetical protein
MDLDPDFLFDTQEAPQHKTSKGNNFEPFPLLKFSCSATSLQTLILSFKALGLRDCSRHKTKYHFFQ